MTEERRSVDLPGGVRIVIRPAGPGDEAALGALFEGLSDADRSNRFFSAYRPTREVLERWVRAGERGGERLLAVLQGGPDDGAVVGDAGFAPLPNGDAELDITVAPRWRGWLAPFLLDALVDEARARDVPNLEAEVLVSNRRMLALVHSRGFVTVGRDGCSVTRVAIGARERTPVWPGLPEAEPAGRVAALPAEQPPSAGERPLRLLVESSGGSWHAEGQARANGVQLVVCPGPSEGLRPRCPLVAGGRCPLVDGADAVVHALPPTPLNEALLAALAARSGGGGAPLFVEDRRWGAHGAEPPPREVPPGGRLLRRDTDAVVAEVLDALGRDGGLPHRPAPAGTDPGAVAGQPCHRDRPRHPEPTRRSAAGRRPAADLRPVR